MNPFDSPTPDQPQVHLSQDFLSRRTYQAVRNRTGPIADTLEGIASMGRSRVSAVPHVGQRVMTELDAVLTNTGITWAPGSGTAAANPVQGGVAISSSLQGGIPNGAVPTPAPVSAAFPERNILNKLISAARNSDDAQVAKLCATLDADLQQIPAISHDKLTMITSRVLGAQTLGEIGEEFQVTRERVRQQTQVLKDADLKLIWESRTRDFARRHEDEIRRKFREGASLEEVSETVAHGASGIVPSRLARIIKEQILTTRDMTINKVFTPITRPPKDQRWSNFEILESIRRVAAEYCGGNAPTVVEYDHARAAETTEDGVCSIPSYPLAMDRFGSWNKALSQAGFDVTVTGHRSDKIWTADRCIEQMLKLVREMDELPSCQRYDAIRATRPEWPHPMSLPSAVTARKELAHDGLGEWESIRASLVQRLLISGEW